MFSCFVLNFIEISAPREILIVSFFFSHIPSTVEN